MCRHAVFFEEAEQSLRDLVVNDSFVQDGSTLLGVERRRVVFEILQDFIRMSGCEEFFGLAFVDKRAGNHRNSPACIASYCARISMISSRLLTVPSQVGCPNRLTYWNSFTLSCARIKP